MTREAGRSTSTRGRDPVLGIERLQEAYIARIPGYDRGITVPAIVDIPTGQVVTNDYPQITLDLSTEWRACHRVPIQNSPGCCDLLFGPMSWLRQDRGLCPFACST
jgi:glutathionyl-hydroquinone reductase